MPRYYVIDSKGVSAVLNIDNAEQFPPRFYGSVRYIYNMDTKETIKEIADPLQKMLVWKNPFIQEVPEATTILASTKIGFERDGIRAMVWRVGFEAPNGFSVPPVESLTPYVRRPDAKKATSVRDFSAETL